MPHEGYTDPVTNDGPRPRYERRPMRAILTERVTPAIKASDVSSAPLVVETVDGVTHETRLPPRPHSTLGSTLHHG